MINFDEYIRQGEPQQREKGYAWQTAIGLQAVDGLKPSDYLIETARKDIEGEITIDEAEQLIKSYYQSKEVRTPKDDEMQEADTASTNIRRLLTEKILCFYTCRADVDSSSDFRWCIRVCRSDSRLQYYQKGMGAARLIRCCMFCVRYLQGDRIRFGTRTPVRLFQSG